MNDQAVGYSPATSSRSSGLTHEDFRVPLMIVSFGILLLCVQVATQIQSPTATDYDLAMAIVP